MKVETRPPASSPDVGARRTALAGALAAAVALATTSLLDAASRPVPSLVAVVGQAVIRHTPGFLSRGATESVGTADKPLLLAMIAALTIGIGTRVAAAARRRPRVGDAAFAAFGLLAVVCAASLRHVPLGPTLASATVAAVVGALTLRRLLAAATAAAEPARRPDPDPSEGTETADPGDGAPGPLAWPGDHTVSRRRFLVAGSTAAGGAAVLLGGAAGLRRTVGRSDSRAAVILPTPSAPPASVGGAAPGFQEVEGLSPLVTPNGSFYRIDEALITPSVDVGSWRLQVTGMVDAPFELTYDELLALPLVERHITLSCVSNQVGGSLVGSAKWLGVRLADLLARAGVQAGATQLVGRSVDRFTVGFPVGVATDGRDALVAVGMNGEPLPTAHGFPARLVVPGLYGYVSATKWLKEIELTTFDAFDSYWVQRNWAREGPIKVESRIDVPRDYGRVQSGPQTVAGVAWAPHRGIGRVEVRVDQGPWQEAALGPVLGDDSWRQWSWPWTATAGKHDLTVRATTTDGEVQTATKHSPFPDGATGHHQIEVRVS
ncbi:MAG: hypothetical protein QOG43_1970 [Actinomycetota bacterium]|jgi:DMSO/TMAO reductase YedYZ molybdopterin-dependent catalytic subunit|nr:hypothetical protein [Actinomycetota bacterium]